MQQILGSMINFRSLSLLERFLIQTFAFRFLEETDKVNFERDFWLFADRKKGKIFI